MDPQCGFTETGRLLVHVGVPVLTGPMWTLNVALLRDWQVICASWSASIDWSNVCLQYGFTLTETGHCQKLQTMRTTQLD